MIERSSTDLPEPEPPTTPMTSPRRHVEIEMVVQNVAAEPRQQPSNADHCRGCGGVIHIPSQ